jgi:hypothetical protein
MPEKAPETEPYAIQYSESGRASRKELPPEAMSALFDVLDALAANPDAFPGRVRKIKPVTEVFDFIPIPRPHCK